MPAFRLFEKWRECETDKATYMEALRALQIRVPDLFHRLSLLCKTQRRTFFAAKPENLFPGSPHLAESQSHYAQVIPGWYADMNLSNRQKERNLMYACAIAGIDYFEDLEVRFTRGHYSPLSREEAIRQRDKLLEELDAMAKPT